MKPDCAWPRLQKDPAKVSTRVCVCVFKPISIKVFYSSHLVFTQVHKNSMAHVKTVFMRLKNFFFLPMILPHYSFTSFNHKP